MKPALKWRNGLAKPVVLDATAILAALFNEQGSEAVLKVLHLAAVSAVNLAEVHRYLLNRGVKPNDAWRVLLDLGCEICPFDEQQARFTAELAASSRKMPLSFADRACLALAIARKATVFTIDSAWKNLDLGVDVQVIR
jgi:PIN domain nuclease of toxin-antitoxin system